MSELKVEAPLHYCHGLSAGGDDTQLVIHDGGQLGFLNLRGDAEDAQFCSAIEQAVHVPLPTRAHTFNTGDDCSIYWVGPSEWLLIVPGGQEGATETALRALLQGHYAITDVSGGFTQVSLLGDSVDILLQKASSYDFHTGVFAEGRCAQTVVAKATALVSKHAGGVFKLTIRRSFADYLALWLLDAASEFGSRIDSAQNEYFFSCGEFRERVYPHLSMPR